LALVSLAILASAAVAIAHVFLMLTSVRRHEIGVLRAVGARRGDIRVLLLGEAALVGGLSGGLGALLGWVVARLADLAARGAVPDFPYRPDTYFAFAPWILAAAVGLSVLGCVVGAALPAVRASSRDPSELVAGS
jgi:ABC-type antimicrobial peptide transport system permease subunit